MGQTRGTVNDGPRGGGLAGRVERPEGGAGPGIRWKGDGLEERERGRSGLYQFDPRRILKLEIDFRI